MEASIVFRRTHKGFLFLILFNLVYEISCSPTISNVGNPLADIQRVYRRANSQSSHSGSQIPSGSDVSGGSDNDINCLPNPLPRPGDWPPGYDPANYPSLAALCIPFAGGERTIGCVCPEEAGDIVDCKPELADQALWNNVHLRVACLSSCYCGEQSDIESEPESDGEDENAYESDRDVDEWDDYEADRRGYLGSVYASDRESVFSGRGLGRKRQKITDGEKTAALERCLLGIEPTCTGASRRKALKPIFDSLRTNTLKFAALHLLGSAGY